MCLLLSLCFVSHVVKTLHTLLRVPMVKITSLVLTIPTNLSSYSATIVIICATYFTAPQPPPPQPPTNRLGCTTSTYNKYDIGFRVTRLVFPKPPPRDDSYLGSFVAEKITQGEECGMVNHSHIPSCQSMINRDNSRYYIFPAHSNKIEKVEEGRRKLCEPRDRYLTSLFYN